MSHIIYKPFGAQFGCKGLLERKKKNQSYKINNIIGCSKNLNAQFV